jgi:hypothetical protein
MRDGKPAEGPPPPLPRQKVPWAFLAGAVALAAGAALAARMMSSGQAGVAPSPPGATTASESATAAAATSAIKAGPSAPSGEEAAEPSDAIPATAEVPSGFGLVVVTAPSGARVRLDGAIAGTGPVASAVAAPGFHDVRVEEGEGKALDQKILEVRAGKATRWGPTRSP